MSHHHLTPKDLIESDEFELLTEVNHLHIKQFIFEQISREKYLIRLYSVYQISMIALFLFLLAKAIILFAKDIKEPLVAIGFSLLFSFTLLIVLHELAHALAYKFMGTGKITFGAIWRKFIFYAAADQQVVDYSSFKVVALAPFVAVKILCISLAVFFWTTPLAYFFISVMCVHSLFCAGDIAMLAFYKLHPDKEIYNFDDLSQKNTFFYYRKKKEVVQ
jgi:hypothetical protein